MRCKYINTVSRKSNTIWYRVALSISWHCMCHIRRLVRLNGSDKGLFFGWLWIPWGRIYVPWYKCTSNISDVLEIGVNISLQYISVLTRVNFLRLRRYLLAALGLKSIQFDLGILPVFLWFVWLAVVTVFLPPLARFLLRRRDMNTH